MPTVSSAEVQKNFGRYQKEAAREPVVVTQYGTTSVVILSAEEYKRLREYERRTILLEEMSDKELDDIVNAEIPAAYQYDLADIPD